MDYYVDDRRLADVLEIGDFIPPFGWLVPEIEQPFAEMLLRKRESDFTESRVPLFVCPECAHHDCSVAATGDGGSTTEPVGLAFQIPVSV